VLAAMIVAAVQQILKEYARARQPPAQSFFR
jgi:hypothetical protein